MITFALPKRNRDLKIGRISRVGKRLEPVRWLKEFNWVEGLVGLRMMIEL